MVMRRRFNPYYLFLALFVNLVFLAGLAHLTNVEYDRSGKEELTTISVSPHFANGMYEESCNKAEREYKNPQDSPELESVEFPELPVFVDKMPEVEELVEPPIVELQVELPRYKIRHAKIRRISTARTHAHPVKTRTSKSTAPSPSVSSAGGKGGKGKSGLRGVWGISEVDIPPRIVRKVLPAYPFRARRMGIEGELVVRFIVDVDGKVRDIRILSAKPKGVFEQTVLNTLTKWRFVPGKKNGRVVKTVMVLPVQFKLKN